MNPLFRFSISAHPLRIDMPLGPPALAVLELRGRYRSDSLPDRLEPCWHAPRRAATELEAIS